MWKVLIKCCSINGTSSTTHLELASHGCLMCVSSVTIKLDYLLLLKWTVTFSPLSLCAWYSVSEMYFFLLLPYPFKCLLITQGLLKWQPGKEHFSNSCTWKQHLHSLNIYNIHRRVHPRRPFSGNFLWKKWQPGSSTRRVKMRAETGGTLQTE